MVLLMLFTAGNLLPQQAIVTQSADVELPQRVGGAPGRERYRDHDHARAGYLRFVGEILSSREVDPTRREDVPMPVRRALVACAAALAAALAAVTPAQASSATLYDELAELADNLNSLPWPGQDTYNFYPGAKGHSDVATSVVWGTPGSPTTYENKSKCAPLLTQALKHTFSWATDSYLDDEFGSISPTSAQYYDGFQTGAEHFTSKTTVPSLTQGDVIAIKYNDAGDGTGDATGHMLVVGGTPRLYNRDNNTSTREWAVPVIDSTSNPHGVASTNPSSPYLLFPDTRAVGTTEYSGVGRGWIFISTGTDDVPTGHWWGANENVTEQYKPISTRPMTFRALS
ncbi:hypothetical protein ALI22I_10295 [Saccharothrix sp. ALI-22-I]|uniref:hypothetical protein n=1 Tax=Saccharothrix sp. ALI-22-I TaxID=1933778 RepID=UPI00097C8EEA|nr:hypothetical protein [Saccharothrix sp. ALI-22-I]ONI91138.1 hypothetical protein ALI22I_10295 [Saccharothrix sp. ALI-22-I]